MPATGFKGWIRAVLIVLLALALLIAVAYHRYIAPQISGFDMILNAMFGSGIETPAESALQSELDVDPAFTLRLFAGDLPNARWLKVTPEDDLLVSRPRKGDILLLRRDENGDERADGVDTLLSGLNLPHGMELLDDWLYIAETDAIGRIRFDAASRRVSGEFQRLVTGLPGGGNHWARSLALGPDGWLYFNIGSSCNVCEEKDNRRATLMRMRPDGTGVEIYAAGLRNSTGFDWAPWSGELYAADIARDLLGDDYPPDELNRIERGAFYGWPYANADAETDPDLGKRAPDRAAASRAPVHDFRPHTTPLGLHFLRHPDLRKHWPRAALVAMHGSWNRSVPDGYEVLLLQWQADGGIAERPLVRGFWNGSSITGRPVDIAEDSRGTLFISDDYAGAVYRLDWRPFRNDADNQKSVNRP